MPIYSNFRWGFTGEIQSMETDGDRVLWRRPGVHTHGRDLAQGTLWPGFIDNHCHILPTGLHLRMLDLGGCENHDDVLDRVRGALDQIEPGRWLLAAMYDQTRFPDGEHLCRSQLDAISSSTPILLRHVNGHASVANSAAFRAAGIAEDEPNPAGGVFARDSSGQLTGVATEIAHERVSNAVPKPTTEEMVEAILAAASSMSDFGITCASDMMTGRYDLLRELEAYRLASERGSKVRFRLYVQWRDLLGSRAADRDRVGEQIAAMRPDHCRLAGVKIFADGAIGSATAAIYGQYSGEQPSELKVSRHGKDAARFADRYASGQLIYAPEKLRQMVVRADELGYQIAIHTIGDYATDLVMDSFAQTSDPARHRIEHAMILSDDQIERLAKLGCFVTFQPEFLIRFQHAYRRQLGSDRAAKLKRARSLLDAGIKLSFSSDRPIVQGDPRDGIRAAIQRPDGYDSSEAVTRVEAMHAYTDWAAAANGDAGMSRLEVGDPAEFVLLD